MSGNPLGNGKTQTAENTLEGLVLVDGAGIVDAGFDTLLKQKRSKLIAIFD
jgi:hypothetical protein